MDTDIRPPGNGKCTPLVVGPVMECFVSQRWLIAAGFNEGAAPGGDKLQKLADLLAMENPCRLYEGLVSLWKNPAEVSIGAVEPVTVFNEEHHRTVLKEFRQQMMFIDTMTYLPDDILVKVDRASMGVSLEARVPILDHRVVEFAWRLPVFMKIKHGQGQWILHQVLSRYMPRALTERPQMGFGVPIDSWLRGPLRTGANRCLVSGNCKRMDF